MPEDDDFNASVIFPAYRYDLDTNLQRTIMNDHLTETAQTVQPRFHLRQEDGLYEPVAFAFVTDTMCRHIVEERTRILAALPPALRPRQEQRFARYDPRAHLARFNRILAMYGVGHPRHAEPAGS